MSTREAGPELDAEVTVEVMGWPEWIIGPNRRPTETHWYHGYDPLCHGDPACIMVFYEDGYVTSFYPSTDIAAAWNVVEKMAADGWSYIVGRDQANGGQCFCRIWRHTEAPGPDGKRRAVFTEHAPDIPLAICLAALDAVREQKKNDE